MPMSLRLASRVALIIACVASALGCNASRPARTPRLVWPESSDKPRIELLHAFARPSDLGIERSFWSRVAGVFTGETEAHILRPAGVAAAQGRIAVADPDAGVVHLFDTARHTYSAIASCGEVALQSPVAAAFAGERLYISDAAAGRIEIVERDGNCAAGFSLGDGSRPAGVAVDESRRRLYVADVGNHCVVAFDFEGREVARLGRRGSGPDELNFPTWLAVAPNGRIFVTDAMNFRVQVFDADGRVVTHFGQQGDTSGSMARPKGIGVDRNGYVYLVDALFDAVQMFDGEGRYLMAFGGRGREPGRMMLPAGLAIDGDRIYVADSYNQRVQVFRFLGGEP